MSVLDRLRQQPEPVRHALFWSGMIVATLCLVGIWALSVHSTVATMAIGTTAKEIAQGNTAAAGALEARSLTALIGERLRTIKELLSFSKTALPGREEVIK